MDSEFCIILDTRMNGIHIISYPIIQLTVSGSLKLVACGSDGCVET